MGETHTPGPLHVIEPANEDQCCGIVDENFDVVAYIGIKNRPNRANARLYAASPDMLHALSEMIACVEVNGIEHEICPPCVKLARAAIRKATEDA
jgi:hypothetical protein